MLVKDDNVYIDDPQKQPPERSSVKKDVIRNFAKFTGKDLFLIKLQAIGLTRIIV